LGKKPRTGLNPNPSKVIAQASPVEACGESSPRALFYSGIFTDQMAGQMSQAHRKTGT
jgi:hypothetical protein